MINQTPISVRMNTCTLFKVDTEATNGWYKRNRIINRACEFYCELEDLKRIVARHRDDRDLCQKELKAFLYRWSPMLADLL